MTKRRPRIERAGQGGGDGAIRALNEYLYDELRFSGNRRRYDDPRNSFLNEVLERRTGIPLTLAVVYLEVARRAGVRVSGVNFPGHFLLRAPLDRGVSGLDEGEFLIVDPFHGGALPLRDRIAASCCVSTSARLPLSTRTCSRRPRATTSWFACSST